MPLYSGECYENLAFTVLGIEAADSVMAHTMDGLLRLQFDDPSDHPTVWNTPAPPDLLQCKPFAPWSLPSPIAFAIEINKITGISFFLDHHRIIDVYPHYNSHSCAGPAFQRACDPASPIWIYMPIAERDRVLVMGFRNIEFINDTTFQILFRTQLAGDIILGVFDNPALNLTASDIGTTTPETLIYSRSRDWNGWNFGTYHRAPDRQEAPFPHGESLTCELSRPFARRCPEDVILQDWARFYSEAPLENVSSAVVFYRGDGRHCRGIILHYDNGGSRALGECRVNSDTVRTVARPLKLWIEDTVVSWDVYIYRRVGVEFTCDTEDLQKGENWHSYPMEGVLRFWHTARESVCRVHIEGS